MIKIEQVKPSTYPRGYSYPNSQGTLIAQTSQWPVGPLKRKSMPLMFGELGGFYGYEYEYEDAVVPEGLDIMTVWLDRIPNERWLRAVDPLDGRGPLCQALETSSEQSILEMASILCEVKAVAVRWTYYYSTATLHDCPCCSVIYQP